MMFILLFGGMYTLIFWYIRRFNRLLSGWSSPFAFIFVFHLINYYFVPIYKRDVYGDSFTLYFMSYGFLFMLFLVFGYFIASRFRDSRFRLFESESDVRWFLLFYYFSSFVSLSSLFFTMTQSDFQYIGSEREFSFFQILLRSGYNTFIYPSLCIGFILLYIKRNFQILLIQGLLVSLLVFSSVITTGKGILILCVMCFLVAASILRKNGISIWLLLLAPVLLVLFAYSYYARKIGYIYSEADVEKDYFSLLIEVFSNFEFYLSESLDSIINRFEFMDNFYFLINRNISEYDGIYRYGSIGELITLIPSFLNPFDVDFISYPVFIQNVIIGKGFDNVSMFIGRAGEAYQILGFGGFIFGLLYGILFAVIYNVLMAKPTPSKVVLYLIVLFLYIVHDSHLTQSLAALIIAFIWFLISVRVVGMFVKSRFVFRLQR
jgi:ABC-type multidrug transport system fused ATPase/permease subunit